MEQGWEFEVCLVVDVVYFIVWIVCLLFVFMLQSCGCCVLLCEEVFFGVEEVLIQGVVDLVISGLIIFGYFGVDFSVVEFVVVVYFDYLLYCL